MWVDWGDSVRNVGEIELKTKSLPSPEYSPQSQERQRTVLLYSTAIAPLFPFPLLYFPFPSQFWDLSPTPYYSQMLLSGFFNLNLWDFSSEHICWAYLFLKLSPPLVPVSSLSPGFPSIFPANSSQSPLRVALLTLNNCIPRALSLFPYNPALPRMLSPTHSINQRFHSDDSPNMVVSWPLGRHSS